MSSTSTEGHDFSLAVEHREPFPVNVTDVSFSMSLPQGLEIVSYPAAFQVSGRTVTLSFPSLAAGANSTGAITLKGDGAGGIGPCGQRGEAERHGASAHLERGRVADDLEALGRDVR